MELESSLVESLRLVLTKIYVRVKSVICPTVLTSKDEAIVLLATYKQDREDGKPQNFGQQRSDS
jgi:hypothetical protein